MLFDTHCHLSHPDLQNRLPEIITEAAAHGVRRFLAPATGPQDWPAILTLTQPCIHIALGIHPWFADQHPAGPPNTLHRLLRQHPHAVVGEIGLDFHPAHRHSAHTQNACFEAQLALAQSLHRPIVLHNRKAGPACMAAIQRTGFCQGGFAHAFSGSLEEARQWVQRGFKIGIGSVLLNARARKIRTVVAGLDLAHMVLETDAPHMSPQRGTANHPRNTRRVAETVAGIKQTDWQSVARTTTQNALTVLGFQAA